LVIEIEITASAIDKMDLFATMGVPEVWRHNGRSLVLFRLTGAQYVPISASVVLPGFPVALAETLVNQRLVQGETSLIRQFRSGLG
jgi:Uma2 family endonuclease